MGQEDEAEYKSPAHPPTCDVGDERNFLYTNHLALNWRSSAFELEISASSETY